MTNSVNKIYQKPFNISNTLCSMKLELNRDIDENTVWTNYELKFAFMTGVETLLSSTAIISLYYCVEKIKKFICVVCITDRGLLSGSQNVYGSNLIG
jgi:hypothetical protein